MKILVAYYSKTGNTRKVALGIAQALKTDIDEIIDLKKRSGIIGWLIGGRDAMKERQTQITATKNPEDYDLVIIGTPIWAWNSTPAIRTYITQFKDKLKKVVFFTTSGSTPPEKPVAYLEKLAGKKSVAFEGWTEAELKNPVVYKQKLEAFIGKIKS
jgi:flavodoxin